MTDRAIATLKTERDEYAEMVVRKLEEMLAIAKANPQRALLVHMVGRDGQHRTDFATMTFTEQVGLLEIAKYNLLEIPRD